MSNNSAAAAENAGANSDEFHSADEADGATRPPRQAAGSDMPHRRDRASSSSSASDSEPEANRAALSETSVQQSSNDHARSQPEAMQHEGTVLSATPRRELDDHEKQLRDSNDDKSESPAVEAYHSPAAESPPADSGEIVATTETIAENTPKETANSSAVEGAPEAHLSPSPAADLKINPEAQENETQKSPDTAVAAVEDALISCSIADSDQAPDIVHDDFSLAVGGEETAENGVHEETDGDETYALEGDRHVLPTDEGPSVLELSSKDDPRVSPRPPQDHQDNAHVVELDDDGQYDDDDDDDDRASGEDEATPDDDEDVHNPAFIPKVGRFYMHDRRTFDDTEEDKKLDSRPGRADAVDKWRHDRFEERSQRPKENNELVHRYGHDIRSDDKAPEGDVPPRDRTENSNRRGRGVPRAGASRGRPGRGTRGSGGAVPQQQRRSGGGFDAADFPPLQSRSNDGAGESYQPRGGRARGPSSGFRGNADRRGAAGWAPRRGSDRRPDDGNQTASYQTREFRNSGRATGRGGAPPSERSSSQRDPAVAPGRFGGDRRNVDDSRDWHSTRYANQQHDGARRNDDSRAIGHQQRSGEGQQQTGGRGGGKRYSAQRPQQHQSADATQDVRQQDNGNQFRQAPPIAYAQQQQQQPYFESNYQRPPPFAGPAQFGGQYSGVPAPVAPYSGPQELYHRPQAPYMAGPAVQPRQPTGAVYFDPGQQRDRQQQQQRSSRPHKGIPIVAPDESVQ